MASSKAVSPAHAPTASVSGATFLDAFNARYLDPSEVAETFIPLEHFNDVIARSNTLIVGPRGTGKTTLLKMLHPAAMATWDHDQADAAARRVDYCGVYVPTDVLWSEQLRGINKDLDPNA